MNRPVPKIVWEDKVSSLVAWVGNHRMGSTWFDGKDEMWHVSISTPSYCQAFTTDVSDKAKRAIEQAIKGWFNDCVWE